MIIVRSVKCCENGKYIMDSRGDLPQFLNKHGLVNGATVNVTTKNRFPTWWWIK